MSESDEQKPEPQISPGKPGDGPDTSEHGKKDRISRSDDDDEHRQTDQHR